MLSNQFKFVIQFKGTDLPGLLYTFTDPMKEHYNISDISLATGGTKHTTFLTCTMTDRINENNRWRARNDLEKALKEIVKRKYSDWHKANNEIGPDDFDVVVTIADEPQSAPPFLVHLSVVVLHEPGAINRIAGLFQESFTIRDTSDSPYFPEDTSDAKWDDWIAGLRLLWFTLEAKPVESELKDPLRDSVKTFIGEVTEAEDGFKNAGGVPGKPTFGKEIRARVRDYASALVDAIDRAVTDPSLKINIKEKTSLFGALTMAVHVVYGDGRTVLRSHRFYADPTSAGKVAAHLTRLERFIKQRG